MTAKKLDYVSLNSELDKILDELRAGELDVDKAVALYERGVTITNELEAYLKEAENKVAKIKADFS